MNSAAGTSTNFGAGAKPGDAGAEALAAHVRLEVDRHGLGWDDLQQALRYQAARTGASEVAQTRVLNAAEAVVRDRRLPDDPDAFRAFVRELEPLLGVEIDTSALDPRYMQLLKKLPNVVAVVLFVGVSYMLFASLITDKGLGDLALFVFLLVLLAAVEALHISVTLLRLKDLNAVRDEFPRTYAAHEIFRHERGTE